MAYTDDSVLAKLSSLNETQESIVTVAQWVMFHRYGVWINSSKQLIVTATITGGTQSVQRSFGYSD